MGLPNDIDRANAHKALTAAFEYQCSQHGCVAKIFENARFCENPAEYEWRYIAKKEMIVPSYCGSPMHDDTLGAGRATFPDSTRIRWEKQRVWIVEGTLHGGESNLLALRRFFIDERSWLILMGEGYDRSGDLINCYIIDRISKSSPLSRGRWYPISSRI